MFGFILIHSLEGEISLRIMYDCDVKYMSVISMKVL